MAQMLPAGLRGFEAGRQAVAREGAQEWQNMGQALGVQGQLMQVQDMARKRQEEDQLKELFRSTGGDLKAMRDAAWKAGHYPVGMQMDKALRDQKKQDIEITEKLGKIDEQTRKRIADQNDLVGGAYEHVTSVFNTLSKNGRIPKELALGEAQRAWEGAVATLRQDPRLQGVNIPDKYDPDQASVALHQTKRVKNLLDEAHRQATLAQTKANAAFTAGPDGRPVPNQPVIDQQMRRSRAGAPVTNISVSTEKKYGEQFAGKVADSDIALRDAATKAPEIADRSNRIIAALDSGKVITGAGADARLAIGKALGLAGASDQETIANTEMLGRELAAGTLAAIRTSGLGAGNGFSNADREFLAKAEGGTLSMDAQTLRRAAALAHKAAQATSERWNKRAGEIPRSAIEGTGVDTSPVQVAPLGTSGGQPTSFNSMPDPAQYTGKRIKSDDGTIYKSDGRRWVRGG